MTTKRTVENVRKLLKKHNQSHLLTFWEHLNVAERQNLLAQIRQLDLPKIDDWVVRFVKKSFLAGISEVLVPAQSYSSVPVDIAQKRKYDKAIQLGKELISAGKVAALAVAGGQGTRLGFDGPKGNFPISPVKKKTLFQIFAENITAVSERYQTNCPWYIMTSPLNYAETKDIFRSKNYYGLRESDVFIFQQGTFPNFGFDGKILLADKANIACSPDGHGGCLKALCESGAVSDMKKHGIELMSYWQIDNPLVNMFDPLFIGLHALDEAEMSSKALIKAGPKEKIGNFCLADGKITVIEYSDLPDELAEKQNPDGSLLFQLGSIAIHIISVSFVERLNAGGISLPLHRAVKKVPYIDEQGRFTEPNEPNGVKLETFVFDALPMASKSVILETLRSEEFAPTKNAVGIDSVETTKQMMVDRAASWLESAGVDIPRKAEGSVDCIIEIAPSFALAKEDIKAKLNQIPEIKPKDQIYLA
jgi:UDP-N-acetylglucosamine/UDP-N-acetylgalactosamine diphosphorylase